MEDEVRYENAKMEEATRKKRVACRDALVEDQQLEASGIGDDQDELFCRQDEPDNSGASCNQPSEQDHHVQNSLPEPSPQEPEQSKGPQTKRKRQNRITAEEKRRSMRYGFELARLEAQKGSGKGRRKRKRNDHSSTSVAEAEEPANEPRRRRARKRRQSTKRHDYTGLFTTDIVADAQVNSSLPEAPAMEGRVKAKALTQLVASIPSSDQNQMRSDKQAVLKASKSFTNTARIDGQGGWKVKGMLTSLYHYQVCPDLHVCISSMLTRR